MEEIKTRTMTCSNPTTDESVNFTDVATLAKTWMTDLFCKFEYVLAGYFWYYWYTVRSPTVVRLPLR